MSEFDALSREELVALILDLRARVLALEAVLDEQRRDPPSGRVRPVPSFVKPNCPPRQKKERKKRHHSYVRHREKPTQVVEHAPDICPDCGRKLAGGWVQRVRQVIEIPSPRYEVIEHRFLRRWCGVCKKYHGICVDLPGAVGRHRMGARLMSLVVTMKNGCRMTVSAIQRLLKSLWDLHLSRGEIIQILHTVAGQGRQVYDQLREAVRGSPFVHADETSWREDGKNHWLWSFSTPEARLFVEDASRGHQVPERELGGDFRGILSSDFYSAYSFHLGSHQRCWVHYLRDLKKLKEEHPSDAPLHRWIASVRAVYSRAKDYQNPNRRARVRAREAFQEELLALARLPGPNAPQRLLAQRIERFVAEMFTFVEHQDVPSDNNAAERSIRPVVIYRKVSGGTRSSQGSDTFSILMSLVGTWMIQGQDPFQACQQMLATP